HVLSGFFFFLDRPPPGSTLFPYTTLFRSVIVAAGELRQRDAADGCGGRDARSAHRGKDGAACDVRLQQPAGQRRHQLRQAIIDRSEEHTSELQSRSDLVCRLLLEKKKILA